MDIPETPVLTPLEPVETPTETAPEPAKLRLDPTRYGDWELNGKCVDF